MDISLFLSKMGQKMGQNKNKAFPLFVSIPHSGVKIPPEAGWLKKIPPSVLMRDVDHFVDDLYGPALKKFYIPSLIFKWHRYAVDANRWASDISNKTVENAEQFLQKKAAQSLKRPQTENQKYSSKNQEPFDQITRQKLKNKLSKQKEGQSASDIHWHKSTLGELLIPKPLSQKTHELLIKKYFNPFHKKIEGEIARLKKAGNRAVYLLDLHSMPSKGLAFHRDKGEYRKDVVISDFKGQSCSKAFKNLTLKAYKEAGFNVALNWPYKGGAVTQCYGQPHKGQEALQVELNRKLYMDEKSKNKTSHFKQTQNQLEQAISFIIQALKDQEGLC